MQSAGIHLRTQQDKRHHHTGHANWRPRYRSTTIRCLALALSLMRMQSWSCRQARPRPLHSMPDGTAACIPPSAHTHACTHGSFACAAIAWGLHACAPFPVADEGIPCTSPSPVARTNVVDVKLHRPVCNLGNVASVSSLRCFEHVPGRDIAFPVKDVELLCVPDVERVGVIADKQSITSHSLMAACSNCNRDCHGWGRCCSR